MSKTVLIPSNIKPTWRCTVNGVRYAYPAGTVQVVPDAVADAIKHYYDSIPREDPEAGESIEDKIIRLSLATVMANYVELAKKILTWVGTTTAKDEVRWLEENLPRPRTGTATGSGSVSFNVPGMVELVEDVSLLDTDPTKEDVNTIIDNLDSAGVFKLAE